MGLVEPEKIGEANKRVSKIRAFDFGGAATRGQLGRIDRGHSENQGACPLSKPTVFWRHAGWLGSSPLVFGYNLVV